MELPYSNFNHCLMFNALKDSFDLKKAIAYSISFKEFNDLKIVALDHSILLYNDEISIYIILYVGFEENEYIQNLMLNSHFVTFEKGIETMTNFNEIEIKILNKQALIFTAISLGKNSILENFDTFIKN